MRWTTACPLAELREATPVGMDVAGTAVCLVRLGSAVFAVHDECTHAAVPLSEGEVEDGAIECWLHGSRFDLRTGGVLNLPATKPVATYPVWVHGDDVRVDVDG